MDPQEPTIEPPLTLPVRVGTMGWSYADWSGAFYPAGAAARDYIALYARTYDTVEIDSTFYGTPREAQVKHWRKVTPENFVFCPKVPRLITHDLRLVGIQDDLAEFVRVMGLLGPKRGPMLLQFPPDFTRAELGALQAFLPLLKALPDSTARFAAEFRHRSLIGPEVSALLAEHNVALVAADYAPMPRRFEATADFAYIRLIGRHGAFERHDRPYADRSADLKRWTDTLRENQSRFTAAYIFCNNDYEGYSPATCDRVKTLLGLPLHSPPPEIQGTLF
jgi:uncharacterized protein YecE (DUF72 family)